MLLNHLHKIQIAVLFLSFELVLTSCNGSLNDKKQVVQEPTKNTLPYTPQSLVFFGKYCSLKDQDVQERLDRELLVNAYFQSSTSLIIKRSNRYFPIIEPILRSEGVPDDFKYLCVIESNLSNATSPAGASGFWQFMPYTAAEYGLKISSEVDERLHLEKSTRAACRLIKSNYTTFNNWVNACAAYNRGPGGLKEDLNIQGVKHYFDAEMNPETARYVFRIMAIKILLENPETFGFNFYDKALYPTYRTKKIQLTEPIKDLTQWAIGKGVNRKILRLLNPWILSNQLTNASLPCTLELPKDESQLKRKH